MGLTRVAAASLAVLIAISSSARASGSNDVIGAVADSLRNDPLYLDDGAERAISESDAERVRAAIGDANTPIYIAVLPESVAETAGVDAAEVARQVSEAVDRRGTYGVVVGQSFRAGSSELPSGRAGELAEAALDGDDDTAAVLIDFVERVAVAASDGAAPAEAATAESTAGSGGGDGVEWVLPVMLVGGVGIGGLLWWRSRRRNAERMRAEAADRQMLKAEISVLASDVVRFEPEVQLHPDARSDFDAAVNRYRAAQAALEHIDEPIDLVRVARIVAEARYSMDRVAAIVDGREPPPPPEELQRVGRHGEPAVALGENREPMYVGYPGGYGGGWFGGTGSGLFSGLLIGSMLGGGFGGWGHGDTTIINNDSADGDGGDFGGGDFGGGDFGGGDFGGGDFGGGDF
jgi:hypothetical protein